MIYLFAYVVNLLSKFHKHIITYIIIIMKSKYIIVRNHYYNALTHEFNGGSKQKIKKYLQYILKYINHNEHISFVPKKFDNKYNSCTNIIKNDHKSIAPIHGFWTYSEKNHKKYHRRDVESPFDRI